MAKALDIAKDIFGLAKGLGLQRPANGGSAKYNLNNFIGKLQERNSLMRPNRFLVEIAPPAWANAGDASDLVFFAETVNMPGMSIIPVDIKRQGLGTFDRRPSQPMVPDMTISFMLDSNGINLNFFQTWMQNIINFDYSKGENTSVKGAVPGEIYYRDNYVTTITIKTIDVASNTIITLECYECWPTLLGDVALGWDNNDQIARLQVNFALRAWTSSKADAPKNEPRAMTAFEQLLKIGQAGKALLGSIKNFTGVGDAVNVVSNTQTFLKTLGGAP